MNLTNKFIAGFTAMSVVALSILPVANLSANAATEENMLAYEFAFNEGLTTMSSYGAFNFDGTTTREAAARFLVKGAEALGADLSSDQVCDYSDLASADQSLVSFINDGCDMGIFKAQDMFNPKATFTRAQAELTIARIVYGMDEVNAYAQDNDLSEYAAARELLMADEIVQVEVPADSAVKRGHLALMIYRLADMDVVTPTDPTDPTEPVEVKAGALNVALNSATLANNTQIPSTGVVRFAAVDFSAGSSDVNLKTVEIAKAGLASIPSDTRVWFEKNGVRVTGKAAFTSEGKAVLSFAPVLTVKANATEKLDLYVELKTTEGNDFQFTSAVIDSSAVSVNGSFTTPVLRTVKYAVIDVYMTGASIGGTGSITDNGMELGAFIIEAKLPSGVSETRNASFKSITLRQDGNASLSSLSNIVLERNGKTVASNPTINGRDLTFSLSDTILDSTFATYYIKAVVNNVEQATDTYTFVVRNASDVNVVEANTAFRTVVTPNTITLKTYNIQGGDLTFARDTTVALSSNVAPGTTNVVLMKGTLKSNSSVTLENPSINYGSNDVANDSGAFAMFSTVYLQIGSSTFSYSPSTSTGVTTAKFLGTATVNGTVAVKMWATLKQTAPKGTIKFASLGLENFLSNNGNNGRAEYSANGNTIKTSIGSIQSNSVVVEKTSLNTVNIDNKGNSKVAKGTSDFTVMKLAVTSTEGNGVRLSRAAFDVAATGSVDGSVTLSLYVNGSTTPVQTKNVKVTDTSVAFDNFTANVTSASGATLEVKASFLDSFATGSFKLTLGDAGLNAVDMLTSVPVKSNVIVGSTFSIGSASAKFTASNSPIKSKLLLSPSTSEEAIITFRIKAIDDTVKLSDVAFTGTNITNLTNIKLVDSSNKFVAAPTSITSTGLVFSNISTSVSPAVVKDNYATYSIVADVKSYTTGILNLNLESASIRSSNSDLVTATQEASTATVSHILAESSFVISAAGTAKSFASNVLSFKVNAMGKESTILTGLTFDNVFAGYTTTGAYLEIYKNNVNSTDLVTATAPGVVSGLITLTGNNTIDANSSATYIVVIRNMPVLQTSNSQDWSVSLKEVTANGISATNYINVGNGLPITYVKGS